MTSPPMATVPGGLKPLGDYIHSKGLKCGSLLTLIICLGPRALASQPSRGLVVILRAQEDIGGLCFQKLQALRSAPRSRD